MVLFLEENRLSLLKASRNHLIAAATLMATSAVGPGFLTQTTVFTEKLLYNFGFVILLSIVIDIVAQVTIWKALTYANAPIQKIANTLANGLGTLIIVAIAFGGLVFNVGNLAGTGLGLNAMLNIPVFTGTVISAVIVGVLFYSNNFLPKLDMFMKVMAITMVAMLTLMVVNADINLFSALKGTFVPTEVDVKATITLVGGTVGGYITFAGAQRLLDAGISGKESTDKVEKSAYSGILFTGFFRYFLFVGVLSVVLGGITLNPENPTASVFSTYFGKWGNVLFGIMIWAASITSVVGATYTSLAFLKDLNPTFNVYKKQWSIVFIAISLLINYIFGKPVNLLVFAGYLNAFILPLGLVIVLLSIRKNKVFLGFKISKVLETAAWGIVVLLTYFSVASFF